MIGYLIDAGAREVREVEYRTMRDLQSFVCGHVCPALGWSDGTQLMVGERAPREMGRFSIGRHGHPWAGNGVVVGPGGVVDVCEGLPHEAPSLPLEELAGWVEWLAD